MKRTVFELNGFKKRETDTPVFHTKPKRRFIIVQQVTASHQQLVEVSLN